MSDEQETTREEWREVQGITREEWRKVIEIALAKALAGDIAAIELLFNYMLGPPQALGFTQRLRDNLQAVLNEALAGCDRDVIISQCMAALEPWG